MRLMQQLPARPAPLPIYSATSHGIGRRVAFVAVFILLAAMLAVGLRASGSIALTAVEWSLAAEFVLLTVWMSLRPQALRLSATVTAFDEVCMARALRLAEESIGLASPNPQVGCVISRNEEIVGEGARISTTSSTMRR